MIVTYYISLKSIHNLKSMEFKFLENLFFKILKFQKSFTTCKWGVISWHINQSCSLWYKKQKPKVVIIFWYDSKLWSILKMKHRIWQKLHTLKIHIYSTRLTQNMWYVGLTICIFNKKLQKISLKISFIWKNGKKLKNIHSLFVK